MVENLFTKLEEIYPKMVDFRRELHMHPELSHHEEKTPEKIAAFLRGLGIEVRTGVGGRGVVGTLEGGKPGKTIALRADFDALPIQDEKDVDYKSQVQGVMHACGHDIHTSALLGVAKVLSEFRDEIPGTIVFVHQFAEEATPGGAKYMIEDGCLDGVDIIYGAHVMADEPFGTVGVRGGYASSAQDDFEIEVLGKGGHGSSPHTTVDPLVTASQLVVNLQQIVSRRVSPQHAAAVTVGSFQSGGANNVIADKAVIKGTVRTYDAEVRNMIEEALKQIAKSTCEAAGAGVNIHYVRDCPSMYNDPEEAKRIEKIAQYVVGTENVREMAPMMGSEDYAFYQEEIPGVYFIVGGENPDIGAVYPHHHPMFNADERSILNIGKVFISSALSYLSDEEIVPTGK
ncbi:amidohydrolase [Lentibacillus halodurans]|uniref:Amidohydrolase n=1 Tax=Lentibacillus halodurans TaxID=237679 RepID=A0A1I0YG29_9BACI|nr:amidohydrolase [Lentibacillus halodurans]SFB12284.1 amidohydrolase [Lentibacillus halodurans]